MHMYVYMIISLAGMGIAVPITVYGTDLWGCDVENYIYWWILMNFQLPLIQGMLC